MYFYLNLKEEQAELQDFTDLTFQAKMKSANLIVLLLGVPDARGLRKKPDCFLPFGPDLDHTSVGK